MSSHSPLSRSAIASGPQKFFASPAASGRQVVCSFSYVQRIGGRGDIDVWFPSDLHQRIVERLNANDPNLLKELGVEWAAIREFALVQESPYEEDFNPERLMKAWRDLSKWRGQSGYRITIVMLGNYTDLGDYDELRIQDTRLQQEITNLIHMLYMEKDSTHLSEQCKADLEKDQWSTQHALPHVVMNLGSMDMTGRGTKHNRGCAGLVNNVLKLVEALPKHHIVHDVAVGIAFPDMDTKNHNNRVLENFEKFSSFQHLMTQVFAPLGHTSFKQMRGFGALRSVNEGVNVDIARKITL